MPPKKKKGSGKGKKGGSGPSSAKVGAGAGENLSALSKEFFLIQIRDLENRLARYQRKCDEVEIANQEFHKQYDQLQVDKKDIVQFLKKQLDSKNDEVADLTDRLRGLQQAKDSEKDGFENQLGNIRAEFQETKEHLTSENILLGGKLAGLEEFKVQKDQLMNKFGDMEDDMMKKEEGFKDSVYGLERKNVIDKDRLKKEMVQRVNQVAAEFRKVSNKQMADTTKRTIRENVSINVQLAKMSDKTMQLIKENDELMKQLKESKRKNQLQNEIEKDLAKKNHSNQKVIQLLTQKCHLMENHLAELEAHETDYQEMQAELQQLQNDFETGKDEIEQVTMQKTFLEQRVEEITKKLEEEKETKLALENIINGAASALKKVLSGEEEEVVSKTDRPPPEGSEKDESTTDSSSISEKSSKQEVFVGKEKPGFYTDEEKRHLMLTHLLGILNTAADLGSGPKPADLGRERKLKKEHSRRQSPEAHYRLGDLGLGPRAKPPLTEAQKLERLRMLSPTSRLGKVQLLKPAIRTVATQTASAPRAVFYAEQLLEHGGAVAHTRDGPVKLPPPGHPPHPLARHGPPPRQHLAPLAPITGNRRAQAL